VPYRLLAASDLDLGFMTLSGETIEGIISAVWRVGVIILISLVVVQLGKRLVDRAVARVGEPESGRFDRFRLRDQVWDTDTREQGIALKRKVRRAEALGSVTKSWISASVWTLSVLTILATVNINLGPYIAGLGIVGIALGFGAQELVSDFISGMFMLLEDQYGVGDIIDAGEASGIVEGISLRTTRIRSVDGTLWYIPNGEIRRLGNMSQDWARALLDIGVAYDTDTDHASAVIERVAESMAREEEYKGKFLDTPEVWGVERLAADAGEIRFVIKTTPGDQYAIARELRRRIKHAFDAEGIEIPFAQRTLWIRSEQGEADPLDLSRDDATPAGD
jgi:small conductance mechanosensitive channel